MALPGKQVERSPFELDASDPAPVSSRTADEVVPFRRRRQRSTALTLALLVVVAVLVLPPVFTVVYSGFVEGRTLRDGTLGLNNYRAILGAQTTYETLGDTMVFAVATSFLTIALAALMAWLAERTNAPFRRVVYVTTVVAFGIPTFVQGMGWILLLGPRTGVLNLILAGLFGTNAPQIPVYSMGTLIFVQAITLLPGMFLLLVPAFRATDPALEEAAQVAGASRLRVILAMTLPLVTPSILAAMLLCFIITVESFEIPALIGVPGKIIVLSTEIYGRIRRATPDYGSAGAFATMLMLVAMVGLYLYQRATARAHRFVTVTGKGYRPHRLDLGAWRWPAAIVTLGVPLAVVSPVFVLAWGSFLRTYEAPSVDALSRVTLDSYREVFQTTGVIEAAKNTFILGLSSALVVMLLTLVASWLLLRRRNAYSRAIDHLITLPLVIPGIVLALATLRTFVVLPLPVYGTPLIILIGLVIHYLPYGMRFSHAGMIALHPELEEAGAVAGARMSTILRRVVGPLMWPTLVAGGLFIFLATIRQLSLVVLLTGPGNPLIAPAMFDMWQRGSLTDAAAFAMVVVVVVVAIAFAFFWMTSGIGVREENARSAAELR